MKIYIQLKKRDIKEILAKIELTEEELIKHKRQRVALILNKFTDYLLKNAKSDKMIEDYIKNIDLITYETNEGIKLDLLED